MDKASLKRGFEFDRFQVFPDRGEIRSGEKTRRIEPRVMDVLVLLAANEGSVVSRDRLIEDVWRGALISDDVISRCIYQLRKELGDRGRDLIRTVPKRGYRLKGPVSPLAETSTAAPGDDTTPEPLARHRWAVAALVAAVAVVAVFAIMRFIPSPSPGPPRNVTVAVSPFAGDSQDEKDVLGPGVAEGLLYRLSRNPALRVLARASSFSDTQSLQEALPDQQLVVLEGRIAEQEDQWILDVRLIDATTGGEIWQTRLTTENQTMPAIEQQVELGILQALNAIPEGLTLPGTGFASDDLEAYQLLLRGRELVRLRSPEALQDALEMFSAAAARDPDYATAYAAIAEVSAHMSIYAGRNWDNFRERARDSVSRALVLDPDSAYAHAVKGLVDYADNAIELAVPSLRKAIELNPGYADAYTWLGLAYMADGRIENALDVHKKSALLSPLSSTAQMNIGMAYQSLGQLGDAIHYFEKATELNPEYGNAYWAAAYAYWRRGVLSKAVELFRRADELGIVNVDFFAQYALAHFEAGHVDAAGNYTDKANNIDPTRLWSLRASLARHVIAGSLDALIRRLELLAEGNVPGTAVAFNLARAYAMAGRWDDASSIYETHYQTSDPWFFYQWDAEWGVSHGLMLAVVRRQLDEDAAELLDGVDALAANFGAQAESSAGLAYLEAATAAVRGESERALRRLEEAQRLGWQRWWWTESDPAWVELRGAEPFTALLEELKSRPEPALTEQIALGD